MDKFREIKIVWNKECYIFTVSKSLPYDIFVSPLFEEVYKYDLWFEVA